jgi:ribosomal protein S18 acetylase RimI-like enzyme
VKGFLELRAGGVSNVALRSAGPQDLDNLRVWKNRNKEGFFFQGEITPQMQRDWYAAYLSRERDFMFIVESEAVAVGCMAFRVEELGAIDAYNIIAAPEGAGKGLMKAALAIMCSYAAQRYGPDIGCLVLKNNPAVGYYRACGFEIVGDGGAHHLFKLDWTKFQPVAYTLTEN